MNAGPRPHGNTFGPAWSIFVSMKPVLAALLLSTATLAAAAMAEEPATGTTPTGATPPAATATPAVPAPVSAAILAVDQRMEAYDQFKTLFETARFEEALPFAQRVVEFSEAHPERDVELSVAYNNLGATQYQLSDHVAAETSYKKSLALLEANQGMSSKRLITPLAGLGIVYAALDQHALAVLQFDRALAVSRRSDGLFNLAQLQLIERAANSRFALGDYGGVERDRFYALKIAEQNYGYNDPRTLPAAMDLAIFYESLKEYIAARGLYLRVRDIGMKESGGFNPLVIKSLIGIGRTHRLQYTMEPESLESQQPARDDVTGEIVGKVYRESRVPPPAADRAGLKSIEKALELLRAVADPPRPLLAEALVELGDWYQATSRVSTASPFYAEASTIFAADLDSGMGNPLLAPRVVFYRPPLASTRGIGIVTGAVVVHETQFSFVVTETGDTQNLTVVRTNMSNSQLAQSRRAVERAVYSPRFENGKPVATDGVQFTSKWYEQQKAEAPSTTTG
ncbi:MAG: Tetratricopeptide repeat protein [Steroidobacteraceae bacterium]|nr:Tetratricopeptide repeat protein [Steroidobacteraceae bacterium]MBM2854345.1 Tetratricopeptide repeat protein [Steroidobacteraceae bacterium]